GLGAALATSFHLTPVDFERSLRSVDGAAFGPEPLLTQSAWFRYHNRSPNVSSRPRGEAARRAIRAGDAPSFRRRAAPPPRRPAVTTSMPADAGNLTAPSRSRRHSRLPREACEA